MKNANHTGSLIFRKEALEKQSRTQIIEDRIRLVAPHWWIALIAIGVALAVAAVWGWYGRIATRVHGSGILIQSGGFQHVASSSEGIIHFLNVSEGMTVKEGDILAVLSLPLEQLELDHYRKRLDTMKNDLDGLRKLTEDHARKRAGSLSRILADSDDILKNLEHLLAELTDLNDKYRTFRSRGLATHSETVTVFQNMLNTAVSVSRQHQENKTRDMDRMDYDHGYEREFWQKRREILDTEHELAFRMAQFISQKHIASLSDGIVIHVQKTVGDHVGKGEAIFILQRTTDQDIHVNAMIPAIHGKTVREGQVVHVSPADTQPHRIGYMVGVVDKVGRYPATRAHLINLYKNEELMQMLKGDDAVVAVEIRLTPDTRNPTGFQWTGKPPDQVVITDGGLCNIQVTVEQRTPISYVLPWLRETFSVNL